MILPFHSVLYFALLSLFSCNQMVCLYFTVMLNFMEAMMLKKKKKTKITVLFYEADSAGQTHFLFATFV